MESKGLWDGVGGSVSADSGGGHETDGGGGGLVGVDRGSEIKTLGNDFENVNAFLQSYLSLVSQLDCDLSRDLVNEGEIFVCLSYINLDVKGIIFRFSTPRLAPNSLQWTQRGSSKPVS